MLFCSVTFKPFLEEVFQSLIGYQLCYSLIYGHKSLDRRSEAYMVVALCECSTYFGTVWLQLATTEDSEERKQALFATITINMRHNVPNFMHQLA